MEIKLSLDRFEDDRAILKTEEGHYISWPTSLLPKDVKEGEAVSFSVHTDKEKTTKNKEVAKSILNEILNTEN